TGAHGERAERARVREARRDLAAGASTAPLSGRSDRRTGSAVAAPTRTLGLPNQNRQHRCCAQSRTMDRRMRQSDSVRAEKAELCASMRRNWPGVRPVIRRKARSEEHTSELQSRFDLVCRLLLEKKNKTGKK